MARLRGAQGAGHAEHATAHGGERNPAECTALLVVMVIAGRNQCSEIVT
jgi:hypothetical protein